MGLFNVFAKNDYGIPQYFYGSQNIKLILPQTNTFKKGLFILAVSNKLPHEISKKRWRLDISHVYDIIIEKIPNPDIYSLKIRQSKHE
jgi:hypothetical protein